MDILLEFLDRPKQLPVAAAVLHEADVLASVQTLKSTSPSRLAFLFCASKPAASSERNRSWRPMAARTLWILLGQEVIRCWQRVTSSWPGSSRTESPKVKTSCGKKIEHATRSSFSGNGALCIAFETGWDGRVTRVCEHIVHGIWNRLGRTSHESLPGRPWLGIGGKLGEVKSHVNGGKLERA